MLTVLRYCYCLLRRMSWDPALVSKEVRLLDHTISMYSLVHVCTFCSQFFDPDFPDGIAYPVRVESPVSHSAVLYRCNTRVTSSGYCMRH
jgi:hypothetical protein